MRSKYRVMIAPHASGSRPSASDVEPTTSQKTIDTVLRISGVGWAAVVRAPHAEQKRAPSTFSAPHAGHPITGPSLGSSYRRGDAAQTSRPRTDGDASYNRSSEHGLPPPRAPEPGPGRGGPARRGPGPDRGGRRLGQDPGPHPSDRVPDPGTRGLALRDPRDHLHEQGRARDGRASGGPDGRADRQGHVDPDLPLGVRPDPAARARAPQPAEQLHDLRRG